MAVSEAVLPGGREKSIFNHRALGVIGMLCAPALYFGSLFHSSDAGAANPNQIFASLGGLLYLSGALASAVAMRRLRVTGDGNGARVLFVIQIFALMLAMIFDVLEYAAPQAKETSVFFITDLAYPFSHILMLTVGIFVSKGGVWRGWRRVPAFLIGGALPLFFAANAMLGRENSGWAFIVPVTSGFFALGYAAATTEKSKA